MDSELPSYRRHTSSSLHRATTNTLWARVLREKVDSKNIEKRLQITRLRIEAAEKLRRLVPPSEKWPTTNSVRAYREEVGKPSKRRESLPKQASRKSVCKQASPSENSRANRKGQRYCFPFPIHNSKDTSTFPQFSSLPTELRLQIWEQAIMVPKFIELQYYTDVRTSGFANCERYDPVFSVCRESRQVAQRSSPSAKKISSIWLGEGWRHSHRVRGLAVTFVPKRDTLFFRPTDHSLKNNIMNLWENFGSLLYQIENIAIPLDLKTPVGQFRSWFSDMGAFAKLKTLTFMVGCAEKSWMRYGSIELRDLEQWFMDGRRRVVEVKEKGLVDVTELPTLMNGSRYGRGDWPQVRVVAWKRKD